MKRFLGQGILALAVFYASFALAQAGGAAAQRFPDVVDVKVRAPGEGKFDFDVTISSPYDSPQRYADGFRILGADRVVHAVRVLLHDHANEQPFTRDLYGVVIPPPVRFVVVEARDRKNGYGGRTVRVELPGR
ncbi:MAG: hypothetical protein HY017_26890 [Betaproteobacteria bacterium]|nr:hypothetical protein [Betaproteobacteria bacterium]